GGRPCGVRAVRGRSGPRLPAAAHLRKQPALPPLDVRTAGDDPRGSVHRQGQAGRLYRGGSPGPVEPAMIYAKAKAHGLWQDFQLPGGPVCWLQVTDEAAYLRLPAARVYPAFGSLDDFYPLVPSLQFDD